MIDEAWTTYFMATYKTIILVMTFTQMIIKYLNKQFDD